MCVGRKALFSNTTIIPDTTFIRDSRVPSPNFQRRKRALQCNGGPLHFSTAITPLIKALFSSEKLNIC